VKVRVKHRAFEYGFWSAAGGDNESERGAWVEPTKMKFKEAAVRTTLTRSVALTAQPSSLLLFWSLKQRMWTRSEPSDLLGFCSGHLSTRRIRLLPAHLISTETAQPSRFW
jgi:hypothetical protein